MIESILENIPAHICALIGFIFLMISTQVKEKSKILLFQSLFSFFFFLQYILLGVYSASILNLVGLIRNIVYYKNNNKISTFFIIILTLLIGLLCTIHDMNNYIFIISVIPLIINLLYAYVLSKNNIVLIKKIFLLCSIIWIIYDYFVSAYIGLICNSIEMFSYIFYFIKRKTEEL